MIVGSGAVASAVLVINVINKQPHRIHRTVA